MKKIMALALAFIMAFALFAGCGKKDAATDSGQTSTSTPQTTDNITSGTQIGGETITEIKETDKVYPSADAKVTIAGARNFTGLTQFGNSFAATLCGADLFYDCLLTYDITTNSPKAGLAESWEWVDDCVLRLHLKDGITSINGDKFTASDVIYSITYNKDNVETLKSYYDFFDMEKTKAVDELTVDIATIYPYPMLTVDLCHAAYHMACEKSVNAAGGVEALKENPIAGTGAYKLMSWEEGVGIHAERRDDYWGRMPYYKYVDYLTVSDANTRYMSVEAGDYNVCTNLGAASVDAADSNPNVKLWRFAHSGQVTSLYINSDANEYLASKEVRQAMALAIDYDAISKIALGNNGLKPQGASFNQFSPLTPYKDGLPEENYYVNKTDLALAKQKLIDAGYPDGFKTTVIVNGAQSVQIAIAEVVSNCLSAINIEVGINMSELAALNTETRAGNFDMRIISNGNPNPTKTYMSFDPRYDHATRNDLGHDWLKGEAITEDDVAKLIDAVKYTPVGDELDSAILDLENFVGEYVPFIPLAVQYIAVATTPNIAGMEFDSMGNPHPATFYEQAYLDGAK